MISLLTMILSKVLAAPLPVLAIGTRLVRLGDILANWLDVIEAGSRGVVGRTADDGRRTSSASVAADSRHVDERFFIVIPRPLTEEYRLSNSR